MNTYALVVFLTAMLGLLAQAVVIFTLRSHKALPQGRTHVVAGVRHHSSVFGFRPHKRKLDVSHIQHCSLSIESRLARQAKFARKVVAKAAFKEDCRRRHAQHICEKSAYDLFNEFLDQQEILFRQAEEAKKLDPVREQARKERLARRAAWRSAYYGLMEDQISDNLVPLSEFDRLRKARDTRMANIQAEKVAQAELIERMRERALANRAARDAERKQRNQHRLAAQQRARRKAALIRRACYCQERSMFYMRSNASYRGKRNVQKAAEAAEKAKGFLGNFGCIQAEFERLEFGGEDEFKACIIEAFNEVA